MNILLLPHIYSMVSEFNRTRENRQLEKTCKALSVNKVLSKQCKLLKNLLLRTYLYTYFKDTFLPMSIIRQLPFFPYKTSFIGGIDYIDSIYHTDIDVPIAISVDSHRRPFICLKGYSYIDDIKVYYTTTVFQRYTNNKSCWVHVERGPSPLFKDSAVFMNIDEREIFIKNLALILTGRTPFYYGYVDSNAGDSLIKATNYHYD